MVIFIKMIGLVIAALGISFILNPDSFKKFLSFWGEGNWPYIGGIIKICFGAFFLFSATQCREVWIITVLGILGLIAGIYILTISPQKAKSMIQFWVDRPLLVVRLYAIMSIIMGLLIIYSA